MNLKKTNIWRCEKYSLFSSELMSTIMPHIVILLKWFGIPYKSPIRGRMR